MESKTLITTHQSIPRDRFFTAVGPVLWIAISYVDPGKWAAAVEGGARFGFDLVFLVLMFSFATILWQYLSALIPIATGRNLPQICREEYDDVTCILLGVQAEISVIVLDLTMVLGTAYGLHTVFGIDLFNCVFLTGIDAVLFPFLAQLLENPKARTFSICLACFILASYVSGVLISQPERSLSVGGIFNKLTGENAYVFMSILGANIMPHNFYLHSSFVQLDQGQTSVSKGELCRDHLFATSCIFSGIFIVNCMLMNMASSVFYSSGVTSLTLQDALSLLDQGYRSSLASVALIFILYFSNQLVAVTWSLEREVIAHNFFGLEIPGWLHRATIRIITIIPALSCVWSSGAEGIFQLLIFTQVIVALSLPSAVIPLFRVASSRSIMGEYKMSQLVESLAIISFIGMLGLNIVFIMELVFGSSDWVSSLKWNIGNGVPISYLILVIAASGSLCLMLWLAITPLKSASAALDALALKWDQRASAIDSPSMEGGPPEICESLHQLENPTEEKQDVMSSSEKSFGNQQDLSTASLDLDIPEKHLDSEIKSQVKTLDSEASSTNSGIILPEPRTGNQSEPLGNSSLSTNSKGTLEKTLKVGVDAIMEKNNEGNPWEPEELTKDVSENGPPSFTSEGPESFRSLVERIDDIGSGTGSTSRLAGLGRAARRQLTVILDEFWGQLFDFHGQTTNDAKDKKLDVLLGIESKSSFASAKIDSFNKESDGYFTSPGGRGHDKTRTTCNSSLLSVGQNNMGSPLLGASQLGSPVISDRMKQLESYVQSTTRSFYGSDERRFHSLHIPSSSDGHDLQPATIHGYTLGSYLGAMAKEKTPDQLKGQLDLLTQASTLSIKSKSIESNAQFLGQKPQNGSSRPVAPPGFPSVPVQRNTWKSERHCCDLGSPESMENSTTPPNVKKYHSLPGISGLSVHQIASLSDNNSQWCNPARYGPQYISHRQVLERMHPSVLSLPGFDELSPSKVQKDTFPSYSPFGLRSDSLWSKRPYEQFGVAEKTPKNEEPVSVSVVDMKAKLLQSFRSCILKLLKLEGSDWLFKQNGGADEDLIDRIAARERFKYEVEVESMGEDRKAGFAMKIDEIEHSRLTNCGDDCVWQVDLIISFGVWCIHRILELSLIESRPELWGKYTYVLNRLQGIIELAFWKPRTPTAPCFCLDLPTGYQQKSSSPLVSNGGGLPPPSKLWRGKLTSAAMLVDIIKDVEVAIAYRKGKTGTMAGDVAFPKGKENLASVLKRHKRRLSNKS